jgi:hypothetical protein
MKRLWILLLLCFSIETCTAQITVSLKSDFVKQFQDSVTIDASFRVDAFSAIHTAKTDGDIHVAGTAPQIGMIAVAEVMNAKTERSGAVKTLTQAKGSNTPVSITGAWRIWSEHGGEQQYVQGVEVPVATTSGEAHVFEIHPVSRVNGRDVSHTLEPIAGFTYKTADDAFGLYERTKSEISEADGMVTISTEQAGYNYTQFVAKLLSEPFALKGGTGVMASILDEGGDLLVTERRLVFVSGTPPEHVVQAKHKGDLIEVVGIPRVSLKLVEWRLTHQDDPRCKHQCLTWNIPYELIVAAVTDENPPSPTD